LIVSRRRLSCNHNHASAETAAFEFSEPETNVSEHVQTTGVLDAGLPAGTRFSSAEAEPAPGILSATTTSIYNQSLVAPAKVDRETPPSCRYQNQNWPKQNKTKIHTQTLYDVQVHVNVARPRSRTDTCFADCSGSTSECRQSETHAKEVAFGRTSMISCLP
jgi:hypothetical protein